MKLFSRSVWLLVFVACFQVSKTHGDLFVESVQGADAGVPVDIDYIASQSDNFNKAVIIVDDWVLAESITPSGTLTVTFDNPGTINYIVRTYNPEGTELDSIERSINVFGVAIIEPSDNYLTGLGSRFFLGASAIFDDEIVDYIDFQYRASGSGDYKVIPGSADKSVPYAFLYEPPSVGLWDIRAVAHHTGGGATYSNSITIQVSSGNTENPVYVTILDPAEGTSVQAGVQRNINVDVSTRGAVISGVDMYVNGELVNTTIGKDVQFPFQFEWLPMRPGSYSLVAIATDNRGMSFASDEVTVQASDDRPHAELLLPEDGATFQTGKSIDLVALAVGQGGSRERVGSVEFLVNGNAIPLSTGGSSMDTEAPYSTQWSPDFQGQYFVQARVIDSVTGASYQTPSIQVTIVESSPPIATMLAPYSNDVFYAGETIQLSATAKDSNGIIQKMEFFVNDVLVGEGVAENGSFNLDYTFTSAGEHTIYSRAHSDTQYQVNSGKITVTVYNKNGVRPTVSITNPNASDTFIAGDSIQISANASDSDGNIAEVQFYSNQQAIGDPVTSFPFVLNDFVFNSAGLYQISAVAKDNEGSLSKRDTVAVRVFNPSYSRPTVSIKNPTDGKTFDVGNTLFIEADALDEDGSIASVRFEIDGVQLGELDTTYPFQSTFYTINSPGVYRVEVTAIDNDGYMSKTAASVFYAVPPASEEGPDYDPINDNRDFLTQIFIDLFSRGPTDAELNRYLEKLEFGTLSKAGVVESLYSSAEFKNLMHTQNAYHSIIGEWPSPLELISVMGGITQETGKTGTSEDDAGNTFATARSLTAGGDNFSGVLEEPGDVDVFVFQVEQESLVTIFTTGPFDTVGGLYDGDGKVIEYDDDSGEFFNFTIQRALLPGTYYTAVAGWGGATGSYTLNVVFGEELVVPQNSNVSNAQLDSSVEFMYNSAAYQAKYGQLQSMDSDANRRSHFNQLFKNRYGTEPSLQQTVQGSNRIFNAPSLVSFTSSFVRNDRVGLVDYIYDLPDTTGRDNAALLVRALLKKRPDDSSIDPLKGMSFIQQVETIFAMEEYAQRFVAVDLQSEDQLSDASGTLTPMSISSSVDNQLTVQFTDSDSDIEVENPFEYLETNDEGWKFVGWWGWISDANFPWVYHEKMGWVLLNPVNPQELRIWHQNLDWGYISNDSYPSLFRYSDEQWYRLKFGETPGEFELLSFPGN